MRVLQSSQLPESPWKAWGWMVMSGLFFGLMSVAVRLLSVDFSSYYLVFLRSALNFGISVSVALSFSGFSFARVIPKSPRILVARGVVGFTGLTLYFFSLEHIPLSLAAVLIQISPLFVMIFSRILLREESKRAQLVWAGVAFVGAIALLAPGLPGLLESSDRDGLVILAVLACIAAAACSGLAYTLVRSATSRFKTHEVLLIFTGISFLLSSPAVLTSASPITTAVQWGLILVMGVMSWMAQWCLTKAFESARAMRVGTLTLQNPVIGALLGVTFLGETLELFQWVGMAVVLVALANVTRK